MQTYILENVSKFVRFYLIYKFFFPNTVYKFASLPLNILGNLSEFVLTVYSKLRGYWIFLLGRSACTMVHIMNAWKLYACYLYTKLVL